MHGTRTLASSSPDSAHISSLTTSAETGRPAFPGTAPIHLAAIRAIERLAAFEQATVLIEGESGTGKSYVARHLHQSSPRARGPFHQVLLSTLDDNLAASDLFGHLSGSYTDARQSRPGHFVSANKGTLFLDEIGKASRGVQRKLLHAVEHKEIWPVGGDRAVRLDVRLVTATNISLESLVERELFLPDLAARLINFRVRLPSLRQRRGDIPALVRQFISVRASSCGHPLQAPTVDPVLMNALQESDWPYNLRQLDGAIQRLLMEAQGECVLTLAHWTDDLAGVLVPASTRPLLTPKRVHECMTERKTVTATAKALGVSRWTVGRYMKRASEGQASLEPIQP